MRVGLLGHLLSFRLGYRQAGVSRYIEALGRTLPHVDPTLQLVLYTSADTWRRVPEHFADHVTARVTPLPTHMPPVRIVWEQAVAPLQTRRDRVDILHAPVNVLPLLCPQPSVVTVHDLAFLIEPATYPAIKRSYLTIFTALSVHRATRVIAVSEQTRRALLARFRLHPSRIVVVPNGVDSRFQPVRDPVALAALRERFVLPEHFFLYVGTLQPRKNLVRLIKAFAQVFTQLGWPLVLVGARGWQDSEIFQHLQALGLHSAVRAVGYVPVEELPLWYSAATVFVYPSIYEGFGLPVLEAMACGTPVLTSVGTAMAEVAGDAAYLVDPYDIGAIAQGLWQLATTPSLRADLAARGVMRAAQFTWERTARETIAVYQAALCAWDKRARQTSGEEQHACR